MTAAARLPGSEVQEFDSQIAHPDAKSRSQELQHVPSAPLSNTYAALAVGEFIPTNIINILYPRFRYRHIGTDFCSLSKS